MSKLHLSLTAVLVAAALTGCGTMAEPPKQDLPAAQSSALSPQLDEWWHSFNDPTLTTLVDEALAHNADVLTAAERIGQSQATLSEADIALLPDVNLSTSATRRKPSQQTAAPGQTGTRTIYDGSVNASYEIDLWGRLWKARDAARAQLAATEYARDTTRSAVAAQTAKSYFALLGLDADVALLTQTLATRNEALELQKRRFAVGAIGEYELKIAEAEQASVAASLPTTIAARTKAEAALAVLLGRTPREVIDGTVNRGAGLETLARTPDIPVNLPADLLTRRPDVQQAASEFQQADASVSEAKRRFFPSISLTGLFGGEALSYSSLGKSSARTWNAGAVITQPLIGLATIYQEVEIAKSSRNQAEIAYAQAARSAYADAKSALATHDGAKEALAATMIRADSQNRVKQLTELRYKAGTASYVDLINAERDRLSAERDRVDALRDRLTALVGVYQALGGGWEPRQTKQSAS